MIRHLRLPPFERLDPFLPGISGVDQSTHATVAEILADVGQRGDSAVREWGQKLDGVDLAPDQWELPRSEWERALARLDVGLVHALETAAERVRVYHERQRDDGYRILETDGSILGMRISALERVGLYVPGGKAAYPSSVIMNAVPAAVAGVEELMVVTPPGGVTDAVLAACFIAGVTRIYRIGGAQAIGALAYGTATIKRVDKIVGPGNRWVAEAKRQVSGTVGIDMIAGPTEVVVLADDTAHPLRVAADLIAQAEHDEDAASWCVTTSGALAAAIPAALEQLLAKNPRREIARAALERHGLIISVSTMAEAVEVVNRRAPEHLQISTREPDLVAADVRHAGAIFLGDDTPEPVGDYLAGPSHVLPTSGTARFASPLGVHDFVRRTSIIQYTRERLLQDAGRIIALAEAEGLHGHAEAVRVRLGDDS
ncbi:MAG TPA: histidinol dehydrogenase [Gemmatimonadales bacterium]|nr:histidinol dehydrogenase [Gemmatimonadales bacterium]